MARYAYLAVSSLTVGSGIVFAETSTGYWGYENDTNTSKRCDSSDSTLRAVLVPTKSGYYATGWSSSGYTVDSTTKSLITFSASKSGVVQGSIGGGSSVSGCKVTVIDAHGTHLGTPTGSGMYFYQNHVIGVKHVSTNTGYIFKGWKVTRYSSASVSGTVLSEGGSTSGAVTTFPADYQYAVIVKTPSSSVYTVTIEALYDAICTLSYNANGGTPTPASQTAVSGTTIKLASAITRKGYNFGGWSIDGETWGAGANYTLTASKTATAIWSADIKYVVSFDKNSDQVSGAAIPSVSVADGQYTVLPYPDGWTWDKHVFVGWCTTADGTGTRYGAGDNYYPKSNITLYAIWAESGKAMASPDFYTHDFPENSGHVTIDYNYVMRLSTNLPQSISFQVPYTSTGDWTATSPSGLKTTHSRSSVMYKLITVPAEDASSQYATEGQFDYCVTGTGYENCSMYNLWYSNKADGTAILGFNNPLPDWTWTAPDVADYDFDGWYTITQHHSAATGETYSVPPPRTDFGKRISTNKTIKWSDLSKGINTYQYYFHHIRLSEYKYDSLSKSYNFVRLVYRVKTYSVSFNANGGTGTMSAQAVSVKGANLHACTFTRSHYQFLGWATTASGEVKYADGAFIKPTANITLYAKWTSLERIVTFHPNGGISPSYFKRVYQGEAYGTLPTPTYSGYKFLGWFSEKEGGTQITSASIVKATDEHTLYAHWERTTAATYVISFVDGTGTNKPSTLVCNCETDVVLPWINSGLGWVIPTGRSLDQSATWTTSYVGGVKYANHATVRNLADEGETIILYANWGYTSLTISFDANGGTVEERTRLVRYGSQVGTLPTPSYDGKNFDGWYTAKEGGSKVESTRVPVSNETYYARWSNGSSTLTIIKYKIKLELDGGVLSESYGELKYTKGTRKLLPTASEVSKSGYTFQGWYKTKTKTGTPVTAIEADEMGSKTFYAKWIS